MQNKNPKTVIFDYGGVISKPQNQVSVDKIVKKLNLRDAAHFRDIYSLYRKEIDGGLITLSEYWAKTLRKIKKVVPEKDFEWLVLEDIISWSDINGDTIAIIKELKKKGNKLAVLSNMVIETLDYLRTHTSFIPLFDYTFFSCDINMIKPNPQIYEYILQQMNVPAGQCIFIDDLPHNCEAAEKAGMQAIQFLDTIQVKMDLNQLLS
jgi:putative hydrolase of the HAD superfamily